MPVLTQFERRATEKGWQVGRAEMLLYLLARQFGPPDAKTRARVMDAETGGLIRRLERAVAAGCLEEVFA